MSQINETSSSYDVDLGVFCVPINLVLPVQSSRTPIPQFPFLNFLVRAFLLGQEEEMGRCKKRKPYEKGERVFSMQWLIKHWIR